MKAKVLTALVAVGAVAVVAALWLRGQRAPALPEPGSGRHEQLVRDFYLGLAHLDVGLLGEAEQAFANAADAAPGEPAAWSNLGLVRLRLGAYDAAAEPIERAVSLAPGNARVVYLQGRLAILRGQIEEGVALLRRAVELDPDNLRARFALLEELERAGLAANDAERRALMADLIARAPRNLVLLLESIRLAASLDDADGVRAGVDRLADVDDRWPPAASEPYDELRQAAAGGDAVAAGRGVAFLRNVLAPTPAFQESLAAVDTGFSLVAEPFVRFTALPAPPPDPSPADLALTFEPGAALALPRPASDGLAVSLDGAAAPVIFVADGAAVARVDDGARVAPIADLAVGGAARLTAFDWNNDFRVDLVAAGQAGLRLLTQDEAGGFAASEPRVIDGPPVPRDLTGAWPADIEMDGDLDLVVGRVGAPALVLRNNGDGTWQSISPFEGPAGLRQFAWADLDHDGDPEAALLGADGLLRVFLNQQAGSFAETETGAPSGLLDFTVADLDADGVLDVVTLNVEGWIRRTSMTGGGAWQTVDVARWADGAGVEAARLFVADLDNNGALDVLASASGGSAVWLGTGGGGFEPMPPLAGLEVFALADLDGDGYHDLGAFSNAGVVRAPGRGTRGYHWQVVRPRAQPVAGDQRINSFGLGGEVEVRAGLLTQKQVLAGGPVHFGLGERTAVDVVRIVWPNGVVQAEFDRAADQAVVAEQRLKGSCPWVFAWDGEKMRFVTDFLWRSPLGLRINALETAGVAQTEDWIRIGGDQLAARDGAYGLSITAELWETHYIDHVSLMTVDHPAGTEVFVDERFSPRAVNLRLQAVRNLRPVGRPEDDGGRDVSAAVAALDGQYLAGFEHGRFQGIAADHYVAFDMPDAGAVTRSSPAVRRTATVRPLLVAQGWVYPTDSSINVAVGQGSHDTPRGLSLEAQDASGAWVVVEPDLGFPAGKSKTMLIDLGAVADAGLADARRVRLRTNLEVYWDRLALADPAPEVELRTARLLPSAAELRYRGFSETTFERTVPDTPDYDRIANVTQRWRDLAGLYTRLGDVRPLVERVDDRYVIMNAGDELQLRFVEPGPPPEGWVRDFVLVGDGWNKDGDFNTGHSASVLPLPSHDNPAYDGGSTDLGSDPVFRRHRSDWEHFHTRVVTPRDFLRGLRRVQ